MKIKKIIAFNIALIAICANSVMSVSALSFPELNVPELEYTPLEIPEDMPSPYENFEEKKAEKMQSLLNKGYGQSYSLGALSMPSGYGQTATDVYNRIGDKSFGEGWQEWGSQIEVPEYSSLASKHATIRAEGQANMDALPSAEQRFNQSKYTLLSNDEGARYAYDKAQEARLQNATIKQNQEINRLLGRYSQLETIYNANADEALGEGAMNSEIKKEMDEILTEISDLEEEKATIIAGMTYGGNIKGSDYFLETTNPDGTANPYANLMSTFGYVRPTNEWEARTLSSTNSQISQNIDGITQNNLQNTANNAGINQEIANNFISNVKNTRQFSKNEMKLITTSVDSKKYVDDPELNWAISVVNGDISGNKDKAQDIIADSYTNTDRNGRNTLEGLVDDISEWDSIETFNKNEEYGYHTGDPTLDSHIDIIDNPSSTPAEIDSSTMQLTEAYEEAKKNGDTDLQYKLEPYVT